MDCIYNNVHVRFNMLVLGCVVYACDSLVMCYSWHGYFPGLAVVLTLPFHFLDIHGVVGIPLGFLIGAQVSNGSALEQTLCKPWNNVG